MAQQRPASFVPDSFVSDEEDRPTSFVPDSFEPDEPEDEEQGFLERYPIVRRFLTGPTPEEMGLPEGRQILGPPESEGSLLPEWKSQPETYMGGFLKSLYEDIARPFATPSGIVGMSTPARVIPKPPPPKIQRLLPEGRGPGLETDPFIAGVEGRVQRQSLITPQEEARLAGFDIGPEGPIGVPSEPAPRFVDIAELREAERLKRLDYTGHEQAGGTSLELPDRPLMDIPPEAGDVRLGFEPVVPRSGELPYPLNVVPEAMQPRSAQTTTRALTGDEFAREVLPSEPITFESAIPEPPVIERPVTDIKGGTAAIRPGEPILPSAKVSLRRQVRENTGLDASKLEEPIINVKAPEPVVSGIKKGVQAFTQESKNPSILFKSVYAQLSELGDAGKQLVQRFQRAAQNKAEYDAAWTEPLMKTATKLKQNEFDNFGAYVEGRMPIPNDRVKAVVDAWNKSQNMMGDTAIQKGLHLKRGEEIIPFQKIESGYWPRIPSERLTKKDIVDRLVDNGMIRHQATIVAKRWEDTGEILLGPQHSRLKDVFSYRDDFDSAIIHGRSMSKRIANHENLGPKDIAGRGDEGIANLIEDTNDPKLAFKLAKRLAGRDELPSERLMKGLNQARKWMSLTSLPNFTIPNVILGQATNAHMALLSRHPIEAVKEIAKLFRSSYRDQIKSSGAFNTFNRTLLEELSGIDPFQIGVGEKINRSVAAAIGRSTIREAIKDYRSGQNVNSARYFIETLLARNPDTVTTITPEMERFAAGRMAEITQGLNNPGNLPYGWSDPVNTYGRLAGQLALIFKKIGFQVTKTVKDTIKTDPIVAIPAWAAITQIAGEAVGDVKSAITGRERPEDLTRIADNWGNAFMLGLPWELATSSQYGPTALIAAFAGPAASKASEFGYNVSQTIDRLYNEREDPFGPLRRFGIKNLPIPGRERIRDIIEE